jgi:hypothetical protein
MRTGREVRASAHHADPSGMQPSAAVVALLLVR